MTQTRGTPLGSLIIDEQVSTSAGVELYLGRQPALDRWVSVRKLPAEQLTDSGAVERFLRGARLGARVIHPNLLQVFDCFALRGEYYAVRNRYHLVLDGPEGSTLEAGGERIHPKTGELWCFDNKQEHSAENPGSKDRIHLIFDLKPL